MALSSMTTEGWRKQNILTPGQICGDVSNVLNGTSLVECAVYCFGHMVMCFMFDFNYLTNVCRLFSGIAIPNAAHLMPWTPFLAYKGLSNCERSGYTHITEEEGVCFKEFYTKLTWHDARTKCEDEEGRLLVLKNYRFTQTVMNIDLSTSWYWIGLSDPDKDGKWNWIDGTTLNYSVWHNINLKYHNDDHKEYCATILRQQNTLGATGCNANLAFVCERPQLL